MRFNSDIEGHSGVNSNGSVLLRSSAYIVLYAIVFIATAQLLRWLVPTPIEQPELKVRLEHFLSHKDDYDILFLGASMMYRAINPIVFDGEMERQGCPVRSFNLSVPSLNIREEMHFLQRIAGAKSKRLRWIFMSPRLATAPNSFDQAATLRITAFNTWRSIPISLLELRAAPADTASQFSYFLYWIYGLGIEQFSIGRLTHSVPSLRCVSAKA